VHRRDANDRRGERKHRVNAHGVDFTGDRNLTQACDHEIDVWSETEDEPFPLARIGWHNY
jgi:hypothetical protein